MSDTTLREKICSGLTIDENREGGSRDAGMNKVNEVTLKPEPPQAVAMKFYSRRSKALARSGLSRKACCFQFLRVKEWIIL